MSRCSLQPQSPLNQMQRPTGSRAYAARALFAGFAALLLQACAGTQQTASPLRPRVPAYHEQEYRIAPGDNLVIRLYYHPELNTEVWVRPDGHISLELVGEIKVSGLTPAILDTLLQMRYRQRLVDPEVAVIVKSSAAQKVFVGGEVESPGLVPYDNGLTIMSAVFQAGGFRSSAKSSAIVVLRRNPRNGSVATLVYDVRGALRGRLAAANVELYPFDIVYVPKSGIARANQFVDQYIDGLLPVGTLSGFAWLYTLVGR